MCFKALLPINLTLKLFNSTIIQAHHVVLLPKRALTNRPTCKVPFIEGIGNFFLFQFSMKVYILLVPTWTNFVLEL